MCIYIYIYIYMYVYTYIDVCVWCVYIYICICIYVYIYIYIYIIIHTCYLRPTFYYLEVTAVTPRAPCGLLVYFVLLKHNTYVYIYIYILYIFIPLWSPCIFCNILYTSKLLVYSVGKVGAGHNIAASWHQQCA